MRVDLSPSLFICCGVDFIRKGFFVPLFFPFFCPFFFFMHMQAQTMSVVVGLDRKQGKGHVSRGRSQAFEKMSGGPAHLSTSLLILPTYLPSLPLILPTYLPSLHHLHSSNLAKGDAMPPPRPSTSLSLSPTSPLPSSIFHSLLWSASGEAQ